MQIPHLYILNAGMGATSAASAVGARRHNENDVTMTIAGLWRYGDEAMGCTALVYH